LLTAIGLHGGIEMRKTGFESMVLPMVVAIILSIVMTLYHYQILRRIGKFNIFDSYALASTYGAVGAVTFSVGLSFLRSQSISSEGYMAAILAVLEPISFILSIFLVNSAVSKKLQKKREQLLSEKELQKKPSSADILKDHPKQEVATEHKKVEHNHTFTTSREVDELQSVTKKSNMLEVLHETITGKAIVILLGSIVIGYVIGEHGFESIKIVFDDLFFGALVIFLLEMGVVSGQRLGDIRKVGLFLIIFALVIPTLNGTIGVVTATYLGLSIGGAVLFGTLMASASFIAAPAIFRTAIPKANPSLYLTSALGITFPYIVIVLLPVLLILSTTLHGGTI